MGESWYTETIGQDEAIMPFITSCNLACGVHGGDPETMTCTIKLAIEHGVEIGAHPSLPSRENFGREVIDLPEHQLYELIFEQVKYLQKAVSEQGRALHHLKPHGALYNLATINKKEAIAVCKVCRETGIKKVYGPPGSELEKQAAAYQLAFVPEGFIDRIYANGLQLRSRKLSGSVIYDSKQAANQALFLARDGKVVDYDGVTYDHVVKTLCLHGDHNDALEQIKSVRECFLRWEIDVKNAL